MLYGIALTISVYLLWRIFSASSGKSLTINIPPASVVRLERVCQNAGIPDKVEVVRQAVSLYAFLMEYEVLGGETCIRLPDGEIIPVKHSILKVKQ